MENWQFAVVLLAAVFIGALIPVCIALALALFRAAKEITGLGKQLEPTLGELQLISKRMEKLSRGFDGGEKNIAEMLTTVGELSAVVQRNLKLFQISSAAVAAVGPAIAAFVQSMGQPAEPDEARTTDRSPEPAAAPPRASSAPAAQAN